MTGDGMLASLRQAGWPLRAGGRPLAAGPRRAGSAGRRSLRCPIGRAEAGDRRAETARRRQADCSRAASSRRADAGDERRGRRRRELPGWVGTGRRRALRAVVRRRGRRLVVWIADPRRLRRCAAGRCRRRRRGRAGGRSAAARWSPRSTPAWSTSPTPTRDPRRAVIACWVRLEQAAAAAGTPRQVGDSPDRPGRPAAARAPGQRRVLAALRRRLPGGPLRHPHGRRPDAHQARAPARALRASCAAELTRPAAGAGMSATADAGRRSTTSIDDLLDDRFDVEEDAAPGPPAERPRTRRALVDPATSRGRRPLAAVAVVRAARRRLRGADRRARWSASRRAGRAAPG